MDRLTLVLRQIVFFLFPVPFLAQIGADHPSDWIGALAFTAAAALTVAGLWAGWSASRRRR